MKIFRIINTSPIPINTGKEERFKLWVVHSIPDYDDLHWEQTELMNTERILEEILK